MIMSNTPKYYENCVGRLIISQTLITHIQTLKVTFEGINTHNGKF